MGRPRHDVTLRARAYVDLAEGSSCGGAGGCAGGGAACRARDERDPMPWRGQLSWCVGRRPEKGQKMPDEHPKPARAAATGAVLIAACNQSPHELDHEMSVHDLPGGRVRLRVGSSHRASGPQRAGVAGWCSGARRRGMRCDLYRMPKDRRNQTGTPWLTYDSVAYYINTGPHVRGAHMRFRARVRSLVYTGPLFACSTRACVSFGLFSCRSQ